MATFYELKAEHDALRRALSEFEKLLETSNPQDAMQAVYRSLIHLLETHIRKEEVMVAPYARRIQRVLRSHALGDRVEPRVLLRDLSALFSAWHVAPSGALMTHLCHLLEELRECLEEEEHDVFPIVQQAQREPGPRWRPPEVVWLTSTAGDEDDS